MKTRKEKEKLIQKLKEEFERAKSFILLDLTGLKADIEKALRDLLKESGCQFEVVKKNLIYKANKDFPFNEEELKRPFAILWDFQDGLKVFHSLRLSKKNFDFNFNVLAGYFAGQKLSEKEVWQIAELPSREELLSKLLGSLLALPQRLAFSLRFPLNKLHFALSAIKK